MNTTKLIRMAPLLTAIALLGNGQLRGQTWQTVLDSQLAAGKEADGWGLAADALGNVFSGGNGYDAAGTNHGIVLKTDTTEANWFLSDDSNPDPTLYQSSIWNLGLDSNGNVYSIGQLTPSSTGVASWYVRKSSDSGVTWSTVDLYQYAAGQGIDAAGFAADNSGNIYVVGWGSGAGTKKNPTGNLHWLVRKSANGGQTWTVVDDVQGPLASGAGFVPGAGVFVVGDPYASSSSSWLVLRSLSGDLGTWSTVDGPISGGAAHGVCSDGQGNIYVVGNQTITITNKTHPLTTSSYFAWVTRKSSDGGNTWSTVDTFNYAQNKTADALGIAKNSAGNVVVVGYAYDAQNARHWLVRTPGSSGTWQTVDDFQLVTGYSATALGAVTDAAGNLLVTGDAQDATGFHWIVRRF